MLNRKSSLEMNSIIYNKAPLSIQDGIPVFSQDDEYNENYKQISQDHLSEVAKNGHNPFMDEELWVDLENSTAQLIEKYSRPDDKILDVGVGLGRLLSRFPALQRYGMDISLGYLKEAKTKGIDVCYSRIEDMPYREESFDLITATDVLEHVLDLNLCCAKILSVLKKGGTLIIRVPYREHLEGYLASSNPYKYVHMRNFDEFTLKMLFERIFNHRCVEFTFAGYCFPESHRLKYRFPKGERWMLSYLERIKRHFPNYYKKILPKLVQPLEINIVIKKS